MSARTVLAPDAAGAPSAASLFQRRARWYGALDARLGSKTRFFGAACVTNRVLAHMASFGGAIARVGPCALWLADLGAALQRVNRSLALDVHAGRLTGPALDERIVSIEQSVVERSLERARVSRAGSCDVLPALDALLNDRGWVSAVHFSPAVRAYGRVLAEVRRELGSPIEFARQPHREMIGTALIGALRAGRSPRGAQFTL